MSTATGERQGAKMASVSALKAATEQFDTAITSNRGIIAYSVPPQVVALSVAASPATVTFTPIIVTIDDELEVNGIVVLANRLKPGPQPQVDKSTPATPVALTLTAGGEYRWRFYAEECIEATDDSGRQVHISFDELNKFATAVRIAPTSTSPPDDTAEKVDTEFLEALSW